MKKLVTFLLLCIFSLPAFGATVNKPTHITILATPLPTYVNASVNWANAGLLTQGGIPNRTTQCGATVTPSGIIPPASGDDASLINAAISACTAGEVVQLGTGVFQIANSESIGLNKGITLRGTGTCNNAASVTFSSNPSGNAFCQTVINMYNGAIADWTISGSTLGPNCGVTAAALVSCGGSAAILISPSPLFQWGWGGCTIGTNANPTTGNCGTTLTADAAQGAAQIAVTATTHFVIGGWVLIDENPTITPVTSPTGKTGLTQYGCTPGAGQLCASPEFLTSPPTGAMLTTLGDSTSFWSFNPNRVSAELHLVTGICTSGTCSGTAFSSTGPVACSGTNTVCFDDPLILTKRQSGGHDGRVYWPTQQNASIANPFLTFAGVENLAVTKPDAMGLDFEFCAYCWAKNVEVANWIGATAGGINVSYTARVQLDTVFVRDCTDCENNGNEYPINIAFASTETYLVNSITVRGGKGMAARASVGAVVAYNYIDDQNYMAASIGHSWVDMGLNGSHFTGVNHFLFEGNWGSNCDNDDTHGNHVFHTYYRNQCSGLRSVYVDPSTGTTVDDSTGSSSPLRAMGPMAFNYWYAYIGNVLGTAGKTTVANGWKYQCAFGDPTNGGNKCITEQGWDSQQPKADPNLFNGLFILVNGNYDYVNGAVIWCTTIPSANCPAGTPTTQVLPNSMYLTTAPAFFSAGTCTYPWPWINSTATPPVLANSCSGSGLPAQARYVAGTPFVQP